MACGLKLEKNDLVLISFSSVRSTDNIRRYSSGSPRKRRSRVALSLNVVPWPCRRRDRRGFRLASSYRAISSASSNETMKEIKRKTYQGPNPAED
jgi:hypothetical protein